MEPLRSEKYPRTFHFPFSEGATHDDRIQADWKGILSGEVVITEKLDGENTCLKKDGYFARSHAAINTNPWANNMRPIWQEVHESLGGLHIFGENLYAIHSIAYENPPHHFFVFGIRDGGHWLSWDEVCDYAEILGLPTVPVVSRGRFTEKDLIARISDKQKAGSTFGGPCEGVVCRSAGAFPEHAFSENVLKFVRKNHVQSDQHWIRNWRRAPLWFERPDAAPRE